MDHFNYYDSHRTDACPIEKTHGFHGNADIVGEILAEKPDAQVLFIGSLNCLRHKPFVAAPKYMREGSLSLLCPTMSDFASGRYLQQIKDAVAELAEERGAREFVLIYSCQWVILSTDGELLQQELKDELGVTLTFRDDSHLVNGDHS